MADSGWVSLRLGDVCTKIGSGATPRGGKEAYLRHGPYTLIRSQNVHNNQFRQDGLVFISQKQANELNNVKVFPDDVLLNITGDSVARVCQVTSDVLPARVNQHVALIRPDPKKLVPQFLRYILVCPDTQATLLSWAGSGGTRNALTKAMIESLIVQVPAEVTEQRAIAYILSTLDDKIELNQRMNKTLEQIAQTLFKSWFVDFEPVKAKRAVLEKGGTADEAERAAMCAISGKNEITLAKLQLEQLEAFVNLADTAAQFPPAMQDSELGEIPEGWGIKPLDEVANFQNGLALQNYRPQNQEGRLPIVKIAQLRSGKADNEEWSTANIRPECIIGDGDVIFSWSGSLMVKMWVGGRAALNQHLFKVTSTNYPKWFFFNCVLSHLGDFQSIAAGKATTMGHIKRQHLSDALCVVPDINHLASVERFFAPILATYVSAEIANRTLWTLRDSLLPKLISGALQIKQQSEHQTTKK